MVSDDIPRIGREPTIILSFEVVNLLSSMFPEF